MVINVHAGHNADGHVATGAVGYVSESVEDRHIKDAVIKYLREDGHTVYDCTVDNAGSQNANLSQIVAKCNSHTADLNISIHLNAGAADKDNHTTGTEVYIYNTLDVTNVIANRICKKIEALGYCNRGVKVNKSLYVLRKTKAPALLIECFFVDDKNDVDVYKRTGADTFGKAIAEAIVNKTITLQTTNKKPLETTNTKSDDGNIFMVKVIVNALNIRRGPGVNNSIVGCITDKGSYTIIDVNGSWGRLKSGAGWINISSAYCKRI